MTIARIVALAALLFAVAVLIYVSVANRRATKRIAESNASIAKSNASIAESLRQIREMRQR